MVIGDLPVELREDALVLFGVRADEFAGVVAVDALRDRHDLVEIGVGNLVHAHREAGAARARVDRCFALDLLVAEEEEQAIAQDRPAERCAVGELVEIEVDPAILAAIARPGILVLVVPSGAMEIVAARFRHDIDRAALEAGVLHVKRRHFDRERLDRIEGDRGAVRRVTVVVEAEIVALADAVDVDAVVLAVGAGDFHRVDVGRVDPDLGIDARDVLDVTADAGHLADRFERKTRAGAKCQFLLARARDHHLGEGGAHLDADAGRTPDLRRDSFGRRGVVALLRDRDGEGPADAHVVERKVAIGARRHDRGGCGRDVRDRHLGAIDGMAVGVGHGADDLGGGDLGERGWTRDGQHGEDECKRVTAGTAADCNHVFLPDREWQLKWKLPR